MEDVASPTLFNQQSNNILTIFQSASLTMVESKERAHADDQAPWRRSRRRATEERRSQDAAEVLRVHQIQHIAGACENLESECTGIGVVRRAPRPPPLPPPPPR